MLSPSIYTMGTVSVTAGSAIVVGTGTGWLVNAVTGGMFSRAGVTVPIASVEDDTHLTLGYVWPGVTAAGSPYAIGRETALAADATYVHNALVNVLKTLTIAGVVPDGAGTLAERNAISPAPAEDYLWLRVEVGYELELYYRTGVGTWLGPYSLRGAPGLGAGGYGLPLAGAIGQALVKSGAGDGAASWQAIANSVATLTGAITADALLAQLYGSATLSPVQQGGHALQVPGVKIGIGWGTDGLGPRMMAGTSDVGRVWTDSLVGVWNDAWTADTVAVSPSVGSFSSTILASRNYKKIGKYIFIRMYALLTAGSMGTASGSLTIPLPHASSGSGLQIISGSEVATTGFMCRSIIGAGTSSAIVRRYDNANVVTSGAGILLEGIYEAA